MLKKVRLMLTAIAAVVIVMVPTTFAYAAEVSEKEIEVTQDGKKHTVCAFGDCITIIYPDGSMEIITNDPSGRIDVMIDGKVTKGLGRVFVPAANRTNLVLEEGSFVVCDVTEEQAQTIKKIAADGVAADAPIADLAVIETQAATGRSAVVAYVISNNGALQTSDGTSVPATVLPQTEVKDVKTVYQEFAQEMEATIQKEQEEARKEQLQAQAEQAEAEPENTSNGITGVCIHEFVVTDMEYLLDWSAEGVCVGCYSAPIEKCSKCGMLVMSPANYHTHSEVACPVCGATTGSTQGSSSGCDHELSPYVVDDQHGPILEDGDWSHCWTGDISECSKCNYIELSKATRNDHTDGFCKYCGFNNKGETQ